MFELSRQAIARLCSSPNTFLKGESCYRQGAVIELLYDETGKCFRAIVANGQHYAISIEMAEQGRPVSAICDCYAFQSRPGCCKHITAVLLAIVDLDHPAAPSADNRLVDSILAAMAKETSTRGGGRKQVKLELTFKLCRPFSSQLRRLVSLRIGESRLYVIRHIGKFITALLRQEPFYFGQNFTYDPAVHTFSAADRGILDLFIRWHEFEQARNGPSDYHSSLDRGPVLTNELVRQLLRQLAGSCFNLEEIPGRPACRNVSISETPAPLRFSLTDCPRGAALTLENGEEIIPLTAECDYLLLENKVYHVAGTPQAAALPLIRALLMKGDGALRIKGHRVQRFISEVLPVLEKGEAVVLSPSLAARLQRPPLEAKIYLDYENGSVIARLEFEYGRQKVNPFSAAVAAVAPGENDPILVRDIAKEQQVLQLLEQAEFKVKGAILHLDEDGEIWRFTHEILPALQQHAAIFYSDRFKQAGTRPQPRFIGRVGLNRQLDLLEARLELEGVDPGELAAILKSLREKRKYYRLRDGAVLSLEGEGVRQLNELAGALDLQAADLRRGTIRLPKPHVFYLDRLIQEQELTGFEQSGDIKALLHLVRHPEKTEYPLPASLEGALRDYQATGFRWLKSLACCGFGGILADDMGLGKTVQAIALILSQREENSGRLNPDLVVAPASLIYNWEAEIKKFAPRLKARVVAGTRAGRQELLSRADEMEVLITSYPLLLRDGAALANHKFNCLIFDEAQYIKNPHSQTARCARKLQAKHRFALTGTPMENSLTELWSIFQCIMPGYLQSHREFAKQYGGFAEQDPSAREQALAALAVKVRPFILRRVKENVLKELPPKIEHRYLSELTREQKKLYLAYLEQLRTEARRSLSAEGFDKSRIKILAGLTRLRQICCHPSLFVDNYRGESAKLLQLQELLADIMGGGHRVLLFSQFTEMLELIKRMLEQEGHRYLYLDGAVKTNERLQLVNRFNHGDAPVFLISLRAGGTGLNLTGADVVIQYDLWWNPAVEEQAAARAHRLGQEKVVQVIRLLAKDTIEEKIYALQQKKRELIERVIQPGETFLSGMSESDLREILELH